MQTTKQHATNLSAKSARKKASCAIDFTITALCLHVMLTRLRAHHALAKDHCNGIRLTNTVGNDACSGLLHF